MLVCLKCGTLFDEEPLKPRAGYKEIKACPVKGCGGIISDVDEAIIPAILNLNKKGYETEFSCAGHFYEEYPDTYIKFKNNYSEYMKFPPEGFVFDDYTDRITTIRRKHVPSDKIDIMNSLLYGIGQLNLWAKSLPSLYEENQKKTLVILCDPKWGKFDPKAEAKKSGYSVVATSYENYCSDYFIKEKISRFLGCYDIIYIECDKKIIVDLHKKLRYENINSYLLYPRYNLIKSEKHLKSYGEISELDNLIVLSTIPQNINSTVDFKELIESL